MAVSGKLNRRFLPPLQQVFLLLAYALDERALGRFSLCFPFKPRIPRCAQGAQETPGYLEAGSIVGAPRQIASGGVAEVLGNISGTDCSRYLVAGAEGACSWAIADKERV